MPNEPLAEQQSPSLYRRHRPRTFAEVVGQEPVVRTLRNAVARDKVHHAYLFVGSRGTGKTSMAKILAACLNCERGPTVDPCGACDSCVGIARASSLDVIEMDAASNNSVDDIRELRESVAFAPVSGRRKVYILDEAHMLSTAAWNAFLKTLEEPPSNTVFVLATTEAQKVPATVVDRCQRFDFQRPTVEQIAQVLRRTAESESIEIPAEAIAALARAATGSFRDALGTLEQLLAYSGHTIALHDVLAVLGVADSQLLERTVDAVADGDARAALLALAECVEGGRDASSFAADLQTRARELLIVQTLAEIPAELALTPEADARLLAQAGRVGHAVVVRLLELLGEALESVRAGTDPRTSLELALVKAARPDVDASTKALLARIERLEGAGREDPATLRAASSSAQEESPTPPPSTRTPQRDASELPESAAGGAPEASATRTPHTRERPAPSHAPTRTEPSPQAAGSVKALSEPAPVGPAAETHAHATPAAGAGGLGAWGLKEIVALWPAVVELVGSGHALCGAVIADAAPVAVTDDQLAVAFPAGATFLRKKAEDPSNVAIVTEALRELTGMRWCVSYELREEVQAIDGAALRRYSEEEWIALLQSELDAEEIPLDPDQAGLQRAESDINKPGSAREMSGLDPNGAEREPAREPASLAGGEALAPENKEAR